MSPQPTQAHLDKATCWIVKRPLNVSHQIDSLAQLIADSEAQAAKAECERLKQVKESYQERALTANNELARLRAEVERLNGCCEELHAVIDSHGYPSGIDYAEMKSRTEKAEAELAAEREKVRVLRDALERRHTEQGYHRQYVDDALDATEDASK
jgi:hypothetical protein